MKTANKWHDSDPARYRVSLREDLAVSSTTRALVATVARALYPDEPDLRLAMWRVVHDGVAALLREREAAPVLCPVCHRLPDMDCTFGRCKVASEGPVTVQVVAMADDGAHLLVVRK